MKTLEEVVEGLRDQMGLGDPVLADALFYLKEYQEKRDEICEIAKIMADSWELHKQTMTFEDRNDPISWSELKQMEGKPVWVESNGANTEFTGWAIIRNVLEDRIHFIFSHYDGEFLTYEMAIPKENQGKTFQVYRKERK